MALSKLRVHIAPVGFEVDRIVLPAMEMKADKVWLLSHDNPKDDHAKSFEIEIKKQFKKEKIKVDEIKTNRKDIFKILHSVKDIIKSESDNDIYINVSSGSKIQAISCMMACMMFNENYNLIPYYAVPKAYPTGREKQQSLGLKEIKELPKYQIQIPKQELIQALEIIKGNNNKITKKEMAIKVEEKKLITIHARKDNFEQARFASLDKNIIQPLVEQWKFIEVEKIGRTRWVKLTQEGSNAIEFLV